MKSLKRVKPGTWVIASLAAFLLLIASIMFASWQAAQPKQYEALLKLYGTEQTTWKVNDRVPLGLVLNLNDKTGKSYAIQLEGRADGAWQVVKKFTSTKPDNSTVVFKVHPAKVGDIVYRAEIQTPSGIVTSNEFVLHVTN
jgi:hypothetical protein